MPVMRATIADQGLDEAFLFQLGRFVANCGYLEGYLWGLAVAVTEHEVGDENAELEFGRLRTMPLGSLLEHLKNNPMDRNGLSEEHKTQIIDLVVRIGEDKVSRDRAIHGMWRTTERGYELVRRAERLRPKVKSLEDLIEYKLVMQIDDVERAVQDAGAYAAEARDLLSKILSELDLDGRKQA